MNMTTNCLTPSIYVLCLVWFYANKLILKVSQYQYYQCVSVDSFKFVKDYHYRLDKINFHVAICDCTYRYVLFS